MRKQIATALSVLMCLSFASCTTKVVVSAPKTNEYVDENDKVTAYYQDGSEFTPVLRFVVTGDTHVNKVYTANNDKRMENMFTDMYAYARTQEYDKLDAVVVVGDYVETGLTGEYEAYARSWQKNILPETSFLCLQAGHELIHGAASTHTLYTGNDMGMHAEINGYHFVLISNVRFFFDENGNIVKNENGSDMVVEAPDATCDLDWIENALETAEADTGETKPIFTFHHHPIGNTILGSGTNAPDWNNDPIFTPLFNNYTQLVDFSAHTHIPNMHPRSIMQKNFTAFSAGPLYYAGGTSDYKEVYYNLRQGVSTASGLTVVEVDAEGRIRMLPYDLTRREFHTEIGAGKENEQLILYVESAGDKSTWLYTEDRNDVKDLPVFEETAKVRRIDFTDSYVNPRKNAGGTDYNYTAKLPRMTLTFDTAKDKDGIELYRMEVYNVQTGKKVCFFNKASGDGTVNGGAFRDYDCLTSRYYDDAHSKVLTVDARGASIDSGYNFEEGKQYRIELTAIDCWHNKGAKPLTYTFTYGDSSTYINE